jgi:hypothetical protein
MREEGSGSQSLVSILDTAEFPKFPVRAPRFVLSSRWLAKNDIPDATIRFKHISPSGETSELGEPANTKITEGILQLDFKVSGYEFSETGEHLFQVEIEEDGDVTTSHPALLVLKRITKDT